MPIPSVWMEFLVVRATLIAEMRADGKTCTEVAQTLSMEPGQVWLINADRELSVPDDAREAIVRHRDQQLARLAGARP